MKNRRNHSRNNRREPIEPSELVKKLQQELTEFKQQRTQEQIAALKRKREEQQAEDERRKAQSAADFQQRIRKHIEK